MSSRQRGILLLATLLGGGVAFHQAAAVPATAAAAAASDLAYASEDSSAVAEPAISVGAPASPALAATTAPPWNPERAVSREESWETVLRFPFRVVSFPFKALGTATEQTMIFVEERTIIPRLFGIFYLPRAVGVFIRPASLGDRTGLGVGATFEPPGIKRFFTAEWEGSTRQYSRVGARVGYGPAWIEYQNDWRPQDGFFGLGLESSQDDESNYASTAKSLILTVSTEQFTGERYDLIVKGWAGERYRVMRGGKESGTRSFEEVFPALGGLIDLEQDYRVGGASATFDNREGVPHWTRGVRAMVAGEVFSDRGDDLLFSSSTAPSEFARLRYEVETGISFFSADPRTLRLAVGVVDHQLNEGVMLLPDLAQLGGSAGLAGFEPRRFHDLDAAVARVSYIFPIGKHVEFDVHTEAGGVYGDVWKDATISSLRHSYGVALRPRTTDKVLGRIGVDWSTESVRIRYSIGGAE